MIKFFQKKNECYPPRKDKPCIIRLDTKNCNFKRMKIKGYCYACRGFSITGWEDSAFYSVYARATDFEILMREAIENKK